MMHVCVVGMYMALLDASVPLRSLPLAVALAYRPPPQGSPDKGFPFLVDPLHTELAVLLHTHTHWQSIDLSVFVCVGCVCCLKACEGCMVIVLDASHRRSKAERDQGDEALPPSSSAAAAVPPESDAPRGRVLATFPECGGAMPPEVFHTALKVAENACKVGRRARGQVCTGQQNGHINVGRCVWLCIYVGVGFVCSFEL